MQLDIIALDRLVLSEQVDSIVAPASDGMLGILPDHAPLMAEINIGELVFKKGDTPEVVAVMGGVMKVRDNRVLVLTHAAERAKEIDTLRAERDKEKAEALLTKKLTTKEVLEAETLLTKSLTRLRIAGKIKR